MPSQVTAELSGDRRADMSSAEAQARYLAALAARAFSDEQVQLLTDANVVDGGDIEQVEQELAMLPADHVTSLIRAMVLNPAMLGEDTLAELASLLSRQGIELQDSRSVTEEGRRTSRPGGE